MKDEEIIALGRKMCSVHHGDGYIDFSERKLIAFARAIADLQKEKDALICDKCPKRGEQ